MPSRIGTADRARRARGRDRHEHWGELQRYHSKNKCKAKGETQEEQTFRYRYLLLLGLTGTRLRRRSSIRGDQGRQSELHDHLSLGPPWDELDLALVPAHGPAGARRPVLVLVLDPDRLPGRERSLPLRKDRGTLTHLPDLVDGEDSSLEEVTGVGERGISIRGMEGEEDMRLRLGVGGTLLRLGPGLCQRDLLRIGCHLRPRPDRVLSARGNANEKSGNERGMGDRLRSSVNGRLGRLRMRWPGRQKREDGRTVVRL